MPMDLVDLIVLQIGLAMGLSAGRGPSLLKSGSVLKNHSMDG